MLDIVLLVVLGAATYGIARFFTTNRDLLFTTVLIGTALASAVMGEKKLFIIVIAGAICYAIYRYNTKVERP